MGSGSVIVDLFLAWLLAGVGVAVIYSVGFGLFLGAFMLLFWVFRLCGVNTAAWDRSAPSWPYRPTTGRPVSTISSGRSGRPAGA